MRHQRDIDQQLVKVAKIAVRTASKDEWPTRMLTTLLRTIAAEIRGLNRRRRVFRMLRKFEVQA